MRELLLTVGEEDDGALAKNFLRRNGLSVRVINGLKHNNGLARGGEILRTVDRLFKGDIVRVVIEERGSTVGEFGITPNPALRVEVVYEDSDVVVFNKPPDMPVHPSLSHAEDTLANFFAARYPGSAFHALYRLDKNTSGLCAVAKNRYCAYVLAGKLRKTYYAVTDGIITEAGSIDAPIGRADGSIIKREVRSDGQRAVTYYKPVAHGSGRTLFEITLETGRTHQIRVHFAHIGHPLCGDEMYGGDCSAIKRQALHCGRAEFTSPVSGEQVELVSRLPGDIRGLLPDEDL